MIDMMNRIRTPLARSFGSVVLMERTTILYYNVGTSILIIMSILEILLNGIDTILIFVFPPHQPQTSDASPDDSDRHS